jgi:hypothetical protein
MAITRVVRVMGAWSEERGMFGGVGNTSAFTLVTLEISLPLVFTSQLHRLSLIHPHCHTELVLLAPPSRMSLLQRRRRQSSRTNRVVCPLRASTKVVTKLTTYHHTRHYHTSLGPGRTDGVSHLFVARWGG